MAERFVIRIAPDGGVNVKTEGVKGKKCLDYISVLEQILEAKAVDSEFTKEYYETASQENVITQKEKQKY